MRNFVENLVYLDLHIYFHIGTKAEIVLCASIQQSGDYLAREKTVKQKNSTLYERISLSHAD